MRIENKLNYKYRILILISLVAIVLARPLIATNLEYNVERVEHNFNHPWSSATLPNGDILVTELIGKIKRIDIKTREVIDINGIPNVLFRGQGGLSDIILHPEFEKNNIVLISFSYGEKNKNTLKVISAELIRNELINKKIIFEATPYRKSSNHYGARLVFLNDNSLIITSGDGFNYREDAQNLDNHFGKIIRINADGSIPKDNPYINTQNALPEIFSYGHRNQQGIAYDSKNDILYSN